MASRKKAAAAVAVQLAELRTAWEEARRIARLDPTVENRNRAKVAWAALGTASPPMKKSGGFASRAGQRQAAERRAEQAERRGRSRATIKKPAAQLDREIAAVLATGPAVTISVHERDDDETGETTYTISDDGGEFDDVEEESEPDVQGDIDERRWHYRAMERRVVLEAPPGRDWK